MNTFNTQDGSLNVFELIARRGPHTRTKRRLGVWIVLTDVARVVGDP
jgi:hypothetical protein